MSFRNDIDLYKAFDPDQMKSVDEISQHFGWPKQVCYSYKYFISELASEELELIEKSYSQIDLALIDAVCIQNKKYLKQLLQDIERINSADSPFTEIEVVISEIVGKDPLAEVSPKFWIEVGEYLTNRRINQYPFTKKTIGFVKSIGYTGYENLSRKQKQWIIDLINQDKSRSIDDRFFVNEHLIHHGYEADCQIINNYEKCH